ncbi:MAG: hypothetical protein D6722_28660 [Bacteroidetes bacterium]|nr:MAG: hypothetical protein D6722_28660 [Bacteroidota bacterium]
MDPVFKKLNVKDQPELLVLQAPASFQPNMAAMADRCTIRQDVPAVGTLGFALAFVTRQEEIDTFTPRLDALLPGDALLWFAYPKKSSKNYRCDFNRDTGWEKLGQLGWEPVRQVAIDADWSALRFRRVAFIKTLTRRTSMTLSEEGRRRTTGK